MAHTSAWNTVVEQAPDPD